MNITWALLATLVIVAFGLGFLVCYIGSRRRVKSTDQPPNVRVTIGEYEFIQYEKPYYGASLWMCVKDDGEGMPLRREHTVELDEFFTKFYRKHF